MFSIITPTYNRANSLNKTIQSLITQTYENWELLIVDDGSSDDTDNLLLDYMKNDSRIKFYKRPEDRLKGANACRNIGIENAKGDYVLFLDSDDDLPQNFLTERLQFIKKNPGPDLIISNLRNSFIKEIEGQDSKDLQQFFLIKFLNFNFPWKITDVLWKLNLVQKIKFDEDLQRFQDIDFHIKALNSNEPILKINLKLIDFRRNKDVGKYNESAFIIKILENYEYLYNKYSSVLGSNLKKELNRSNTQLIKFIISLKSVDYENYVFWKNKVNQNKTYPIKTKFFLKLSHIIYEVGKLRSVSLGKKMVSKLLIYY